MIDTIKKLPQKLYGCEAVSNLINKYIERDGTVLTLEEGSLGYGLTVMFGDGLKTTVVKEYPINCWSSGHTIRKYKKIPKKYEQMITAFYEREE